MAPAKVSHHEHGYLRGRCSAKAIPNKRQQIRKHNGPSTFPFSCPMHLLPKHDQFVGSLSIRGNSLSKIDSEDPYTPSQFNRNRSVPPT